MNFELSNSLEKGSEGIICPGIMRRLLPKGYNPKRFSHFAKVWEMHKKQVPSMKETVEADSEEKVHRPGLGILKKWFARHHLLQFQDIFTFRSPAGVQVQSGFGAFFKHVT